jgi:hypothetical protein
MSRDRNFLFRLVNALHCYLIGPETIIKSNYIWFHNPVELKFGNHEMMMKMENLNMEHDLSNLDPTSRKHV